jgi:anaerobic ribonucleoside-triphosphate reductase/ribosomal protein S25
VRIEDIVKIASALNREEKIKIISLIAREGPQSITDIRNKLKLSFSTAFKYLNELEKAGILSCKKIRNGRRKNLYTLNRFQLLISPETLRFPEKKPKEKKIMVIDFEGNLTEFGISNISSSLLKSGIPVGVIKKIENNLSSKIYPGMTVQEIKDEIANLIRKEMSTLSKLEEVVNEEIFRRKRNLLDELEEIGMGKIANMHLERYLHIRNVGRILPLAIQHNFYTVIKHGLKFLGFDARPAKHLNALISHMETVIGASNTELADPQQGFEFFNVFLAPFARNISKYEMKQCIERIIYSLDQKYKTLGIRNMRYVFSLELTLPKFLKDFPAIAGGRMIGNLGDYESEMIEILEMFIDILNRKKPIATKLLIKIRDKNIPEKILENLNNLYFANLIPRYQSPNCNYMFDWSRFDSAWKGWKRSFGTIEAQFVSLNLPRIALLAKDESKVKETLQNELEIIRDFFEFYAKKLMGEKFALRYLNKVAKGEPSKFCHFDDGVYNIGIIGMKEFIELIAGKYEENKKLAIDILKFIRKVISKWGNLRVGIIEVDYSPLNKGFAIYDKLRFGGKYRAYTGGVNANLRDEEKIDFLKGFHPFLNGGHMCQLRNLTKEKFFKILKTDIGLFAGKCLDKL